MDLAKNLAQWRGQTPEQWIALANRYLPPVVIAVFVLLIAVKGADLTWRLLDSPSVDTVPLAPSASGQSTPSGTAGANYDALQAWRPFGEPPSGEEVIARAVIDDAPLTDLNVTLNGVVQAQELPESGEMIIIEDGGIAIITSGRGQQRVYRVGDPIEEVSNARLHSVFKDWVMLERSAGRIEKLAYPEVDAPPISQPNSRVLARQPTRNERPETLNSAAALADAVGEAAAVIGEHMTVAAQMENGEMIGFRIQPRGDGQVFSQLGLEPGDVLTQVNGLPLNDLRNTSEVIQALSETQQANVTIRRNGVDQAMVIDMGQIERLAESLQ